MSGGASFWIRGGQDTVLGARLGAWRDVEVDGAWLQVTNDHEPPRELMAELSRTGKTDVLWVSYQSVVDAFEFLHYQGGALVRELVYGCEDSQVWERVSGKRQPWEPWPDDPVIGEMEPFPRVWDVFEHHGLLGASGKEGRSRGRAKASPKPPPEDGWYLKARLGSTTSTSPAKKSTKKARAKPPR
jgi:hypothetical protein